MHTVSFYETERGKEVVLNFIDSFSKPDRDRIFEDIRTLQYNFPIGMPLSRYLTDKLWELRISTPSKCEVRLLYFFDKPSQCIVIAHGFVKKSAKIPKSELSIGLKRKRKIIGD